MEKQEPRFLGLGAGGIPFATTVDLGKMAVLGGLLVNGAVSERISRWDVRGSVNTRTVWRVGENRVSMVNISRVEDSYGPSP